MASGSLREVVAESIGTYTLIFVGAGAILSTGNSDLLRIALARGLAIGVMVSATGHISGGHPNPAVAFGALVGRQIPPRVGVGYWVSQLLGGLSAAVCGCKRRSSDVSFATQSVRW